MIPVIPYRQLVLQHVRSALLLFGMILFSTLSFSQNESEKSKALEAFEAFDYPKVVSLLGKQKVLTREESKALAISYYKMFALDSAERYMHKALRMRPAAEDIYTYAQMLKMNGKYEEACNWLKTYSALNQKDSRVTMQSISLGYYQNLQSNLSAVTLENVSINSELDDFAPVFFKDELVFTSNAQYKGPVNRIWKTNNTPFLDVVIAERYENGQLKRIRPFSTKINGKFHDGPISFAKDFNFLVITKNAADDKENNADQKLKLFSSQLQNEEWTDLIPILSNDNTYSITHPALSSKGDLLLFVSDMEGGKGGTDIYESHLNDDGTWTEPVNLGLGINTEGNEAFPAILNDSVIYFSSDGLPGLGGMDLFRAEYTTGGRPKNIINLGAPYNSSYDDFGIAIDNAETSGYISSNRPEGKGGDDLYYFTTTGGGIRETVEESMIKGLYVFQNEPKGDVTVTLTNSDGNEVGVAQTDSAGSFSFTGLEYHEAYTIEVNEFGGANKNTVQHIFFLNHRNDIIDSAMSIGVNSFSFEHLPRLNASRPDQIREEDLKTVKFTGQFRYENLPQEGMMVEIMDENVLKGIAITDSKGKFEFSRLAPEHAYIIRIAEPDVEMDLQKLELLVIEDERLKESVAANENGQFEITTRSLAIDRNISLYNPGKIMGRVIYKDEPLEGVGLALYDEADHFLTSTVTDYEGRFIIKNLQYSQKYVLKVEEGLKSRMLKDIRIVQLKRDFSIKNALDRIDFTSFEFTLLPKAKPLRPEMSEVDDSQLFQGLLVADNLPIMDRKVFLLNSELVYVDSVTTSVSGQFEFVLLDKSQDYYIESERFSNSPTMPMEVRVIDSNRLAFSAKNQPDRLWLRPKINQQIEQMDEVDPIVDVLGLFVQEGAGVEGVELLILDEEGNQIGEAKTKPNGSFSVDDLSLYKKYDVKILKGYDGALEECKVYIMSAKGHRGDTAEVTEQGNYRFEVLPSLQASRPAIVLEEDNIKINWSTVTLSYQDSEFKEALQFSVLDSNGKKVAERSIWSNQNSTIDYLIPNGLYFVNISSYGNAIPSSLALQLNELGDDTPYEDYKRTAATSIAFVAPGNHGAQANERLKEASDPALRPLYFEFGATDVTSESLVDLDRVVKFLNLNPEVSIEVRSYTDSKGASSYNKALSQKRAEIAVKYLTDAGIQRDRLKALGLGESNILNGCEDGVDCTDEEHAVNRRTEFFILE